MLTTAGNPICAAAARAVLRTIVEDDLAGRAGETGQYLFNGLMELASRHSVIREVRGRGLALGVGPVGGQREMQCAGRVR